MKTFQRVRIGLMLVLLACSIMAEARTWTLEECIAYAMENNIALQKSALTRLSAAEDVALSEAQLLPSLNFSTNQNVTYKPWTPSGTALVADGRVQSSIDKVYYNGSYNVGANWTVWNGNRNRNQVKANKLAEKGAELDSITQAQNLKEQIAQLYVQILYTKEAINVNEAALASALTNEERGKTMYEVGSISYADFSQLTAQRAQDEYSVVQSQSQYRNFARQLKQLLQITDNEPFDVVEPTYSEAMALQAIPSMGTTYEAALEHRPEIKRAVLAAQSAEMQEKIAKAQRLPTVSMNAAVSTSTSSMGNDTWGIQMRNNFNVGGGVTVSIPILDQRSTRTAVNKARLQKQQAELDMLDRQTTLFSTIENYYIQAGNYQSQFKAAQVSTKSCRDSYNLLSEQFAVGLKNIVELQDGKNRLLSAQQNELQSKYMTILYIKMLEFYSK